MTCPNDEAHPGLAPTMTGPLRHYPRGYGMGAMLYECPECPTDVLVWDARP